MARGDVTIRLLGEVRDLNRKLGQTESRLVNFGKKLRTGLAVAGVAIGVEQLGSGLFNSVGKASDLEESMNKVDAVFGESAGTMRQFIEGANDIGLSDRKAAEYAGTLGNMLDQLGVASDESARLSEQTIRLAADYGSFNNMPTEQVLEAINGALRGEFDALQRVVPTINAAAVETRAMEMTGKNNAKQLTAQDKALAALDIVYTDAGEAAGDFERTSGDLANAQRRLSSKIDDLQAKIGEKLVPVVESVVNWLADDLGPAIGNVRDEISDWIDENQNLIRTVQKVGRFIRDELITRLDGLFTALAGVANFIGAVFEGDWRRAWDSIKQVFQGAIDAIFGGLKELPGKARAKLREMRNAIRNKIGDLGSGVANWMRTFISNMGNQFGKIPGLLGTAVSTIPGRFATWAHDWGRRIADGIISGLGNIAGRIADKVGGGLGQDPVSRAIKGFEGFIDRFDSGGVVPGRRGAPRLAVVHGGETVLPTHKEPAAGMGHTVNITANTNASSHDIAREVGWQLRMVGVS